LSSERRFRQLRGPAGRWSSILRRPPAGRRLPATPGRAARWLLLAAVAAAAAGAGCRHDMQDQNKLIPYRASVFFPNGASARLPPEHTVARGELRADEAYYTGVRGGKPVADLPFPVTREVLRRGQQRYDIFCAPCHGRLGDGRGMIVTRGYKQPPSFHGEMLRNAQVGYFFNVMSQGFGVMPSYAAQVSVPDRWAIAAYIRALQYSQNAPLAELPPEARAAIESDLKAAPAAPGGPAAAPSGTAPAPVGSMPAPAGPAAQTPGGPAAQTPGGPVAAPGPGAPAAAPPPGAQPQAPPTGRPQTSEVP
jgi:Cytochrome C oxidase, cbb3-type, subunit III